MMTTATLLAVTLAAWGWLLYQQQQMATLPMDEMWMPPSDWQWSSYDFTVVFLMWAVMMAAMMLPSALPMIKSYARVCRQRQLHEASYSALFSLAYLFIWFAFSIVLTLLQWQFHSLKWLSPMMDNRNPVLAAAIFITAGLYQLTPMKHNCLTLCQSPMGFLLNHWRNGYRGAISMGAQHGLYCLGCCWAQMLIMFAVGVMNIHAMVLITLFIVLEKNLPQKPLQPGKISGYLLCFWGLALLLE